MLRDNKTIIEGLNLVVNDGEKAALIGEEGNGKSTLLRWIMDPKSVKDYAHVTGSVYTGNAKCGISPRSFQSHCAQKRYMTICAMPAS